MRSGIQKAIALVLILGTVAISACSGGGQSAEPAATSGQSSGSTSQIAPTQPPADKQIGIAPDFTLPNAKGSAVTLSELSSESPVVLVFYRAFW